MVRIGARGMFGAIRIIQTMRTILLLAALLGAASLPARAEPAPHRLTFCVEHTDVRPWQTREGDGLNYRLLNQVARSMGLAFVYEMMAWPRCLALLEAGQVDGAFAVSFKPERLQIGAYPGGATPDPEQRLHMDRYVVLRRLGSPVHWDGTAFSRLDGRVGAQLGYSVVSRLQALGVPVDDGAQSAGALLRKLRSGRVGAVAMLEGEARASLAADPQLAGEIEILPQPLEEKPYFLMLAHALLQTQPQLARRVWAGIAQARESPLYRAEEERAFSRAQGVVTGKGRQ